MFTSGGLTGCTRMRGQDTRPVDPCCDPNCLVPLGGPVARGYTRPMRCDLSSFGVEGYACRTCYHRIYSRFVAGKPLFAPRRATTKIRVYESSAARDAAHKRDRAEGEAEFIAGVAMLTPLPVLSPPFSLNELTGRGFSEFVISAWYRRDLDEIVGPIHETTLELTSSWSV